MVVESASVAGMDELAGWFRAWSVGVETSAIFLLCRDGCGLRRGLLGLLVELVDGRALSASKGIVCWVLVRTVQRLWRGLGLGKNSSDRSCNLSREVAGFVLLLLTTGTGNVPSSFAVVAP